jgi:hypothetical protein
MTQAQPKGLGLTRSGETRVNNRNKIRRRNTSKKLQNQPFTKKHRSGKKTIKRNRPLLPNNPVEHGVPEF